MIQNMIMYMIINDSLNMSTGKIAAQVGHAAHGIIKGYYQKTYPKNILDNYKLWIKNNQRIISLKANNAKFNKILEEYPDCYYVVDAGYTEVPPGSKTVIILQPMLKENSGILKKLQCL